MKQITLISPIALISLIVPFLNVPVSAANVPASSCSTAAVQAAVNTAQNGDTVVIPSCPATAYTTPVTIASKSLTIQGQTTCSGTPSISCVDNTIIQDNSTGGLFVVTNNAPNFVTIEGITCINCGETGGSFVMNGTGTANFDVTFRITRNHLIMVASRAFAPIGTYGLIDHNLFDSPGGSLQSISIFGSPSGSDFGFTPWTKGFTPGTDSAVYVEDNTFNYSTGTGDDSIDAYNGARLVIRHNNFINAHTGFHGTDSGGRSPILWEIYNNIYTNNSSATYDMLTIRGGTGFVFSNTYNTGSGGHGFANVALKDYRACSYDSTNWGQCNGTKWGLESVNHSLSIAFQVNTSGPAFWCSQNRDMQCTVDSDCGTGNHCNQSMDSSTDVAGYPCRDQPGLAPGQVSAPVYLWNNSGGSGATADNFGMACTGPNQNVGISYYIASNREYYNFNSSFNGSTGTGQGSLSARPSACTPSVAYFATDTNTLYQCSSPNKWTSYYTPYTYPHPLQSGSPPTPLSGQKPVSPTNLAASVN